MADHAIVLYDPTIDDRPDPAEIERLKAEAEKKKAEEAARGPHKSLKSILGIVDVKKKEEVKVPVVIDPRLAKTLRPHQIEGVKVSTRRDLLWITSSLTVSSCTSVQRVSWRTKRGAASWRTRWVSVSSSEITTSEAVSDL